MKEFSQIVPDAVEFDRKLHAIAQQAVAHTVTVITKKARAEHAWKDRTFATRDSIAGAFYVKGNGAEGEVTAGLNAVRLNYGTKPHPIWPKVGFNTKKKLKQGQSRRKEDDIGTHRVALRFTMGGKTVFARMVNHPGTTGDHFLDAAADAAGEELFSSFDSLLSDAL